MRAGFGNFFMKPSTTGRPLGEVASVILVLLAKAQPDGDPMTLRELAEAGQIGIRVARFTLTNLHRAGKVEIVGYRRVYYRNRPIAEYRLAAPNEHHDGVQGLSSALASWR